MTILFYCPWHDRGNWLKQIKKKFKNNKIVTLKDKPNFSKIKCAIIWDLPDGVYQKLANVKLLFSMGAGVDHILNLPSYNKTPIVRIRDSFMAERMSNHVISQVLQYQLDLKNHMQNQKSKLWIGEASKNFKEPILNTNLMVGILGLGFLGSHVGNNLIKLGYNVQGFKNSKPTKKNSFPIYFKKKDLKKFVSISDIIVSILPSTTNTFNFIDKKFLNTMKKRALLVNVGRGSSINEEDLIYHLRNNKLFYASLDVFKKEPLKKTHPFWNLKNVTVTPHIASLTVIDSAVKNMYQIFQKFKKDNKYKGNVDLKKGY